MTRQHNSQFLCPNCNTMHTAESGFGRWIRNNPALDSGDGYMVIDQDYWIHQFKKFENRKFQCILGVEIKTYGASLTDAQRDTLNILNQILRNRRTTPTKVDRLSDSAHVRTVYSTYSGEMFNLRAFGIYILTFSGAGPEDSDRITWRGGDARLKDKEITLDQLTGLLRFDLDPDTLKPLDLRNHHQTHHNKVVQLELSDFKDAQ